MWPRPPPCSSASRSAGCRWCATGGCSAPSRAPTSAKPWWGCSDVAASERVPMRQVLEDAEALNRRLGHESLGFLSATHGFLPLEPPRLTLAASHRAWDEVAAALPEMFRTLTLRRQVAAMPLLSATEDALPEGDLYRAAAILGIL